MTNTNALSPSSARPGLRFGLFLFLFLVSIFLSVVCRGVLGFFVDPIPRYADFVFFLASLAIVFTVAVRIRVTSRFFLDRTALRTLTLFFVIWLIFVSVRAVQINANHLDLEQNPIFAWNGAYCLTFPCSFLLLEDTFTWSLMVEGLLLKNPLLTRFIIYCVYWPLIFLIEGTLYWGFLFYTLRAIVAFFRWIFGKKAVPTGGQASDSASGAVSEAAFQTRANPGAGGLSGDGPVEPLLKKKFSFGAGFLTGFLILAALGWAFFITTNIKRTKIWHQDFSSTRILLSRFYHEYGRLPQTWDEIVESPIQPYRHQGDPTIGPNEHYYQNPGLSDRVLLNFEHLSRIDGETVLPSADWIFRIAERGKLNPTGEVEPFCWDLWQISLCNLIALDIFFRSLPSEDANAAQESAKESAPTESAPPENPSADPATTDSATTDSATTDSATTDSATTDSATTDSATTEPATTEPATTEPAPAEPAPAEPVPET